MNENENTTIQNLWDTIKAVLRGKFIAIQAYLKKQEKSQINNLTLHLVKFSCSVMSDSLRPHESQHARLTSFRKQIILSDTPLTELS